MNKIFFFLLFIIATPIVAQTTYFHKIYNSDTTGLQSVAVLSLQDGYLLSGAVGGLNYSALYTRQISFSGLENWTGILDDEGLKARTILTGNSLIKTNDNHFITIGGVEDTLFSNNWGILMIKHDVSGQILWKRQFTSELAEFPHGVLQASDSGYFIYGFQRIVDEPAWFYCIKTDSEGNQEWEQTYGLDGHSVAFAAEQTQDKGYIISGYGYHLTKGYQMYIVKTDSLGNVEWERDYGTPENDGGTFLKGTPDGGFIMTGTQKLSDSKHFYIAKIDAVGDIIWEKDYKMGAFSGSDSPFVITENQEIVSPAYHVNPGEPSDVSIIKFNAVGDSLWRRPLAPYEDTENNLRDIEMTSDGGFILAGFVYETPQSSWVVKTDSLGNTCSYVGCDSVGVVSAAPVRNENPYHISLSPNPASTQLTVGYQIPLRYPYATFYLYNLSGQQVREEVLHSYKQSEAVLVSGLEAGLYLYKVVLGGREVGSGKLVVE